MKRSLPKKNVSPQKNALRVLFFLPILLALIGLFFVFEASSVKSFSEYQDSFHYFKLQVAWVGIGVATMFIAALFDYHRFYYLALYIFAFIIFLLVIVLLPGIGHAAGGARRWIDLGFFNLQPSEFAKIATIIYLSSWFANHEKKRFFSFFILLGFMMFLIILQPDMGTALILFSVSIILYFLAGVELYYLLFLLPASLVAFLFLIKIEPYRFRRILAFFDPQLDPQGITYHISQIMISLTSGGLFGQGFGASRQKYLFLPEAHTDSIFAIVGEEAGFIGGFLLIVAFAILLFYIYKVVTQSRERFAFLLSGGIFALFSLQICVNLAGMVNLLPLTGVPLPFISYGGSNLLTSFFLIGIIINIARTNRLNGF